MEKRTKFPEKKSHLIAEYKELLKKATAAYLIKFSGTSVENLTNFRKKLSGDSSQLKVLQNRLAKIALKDTDFSSFNQHLTSDNAIIVTKDAITAAKSIAKAAAENETIKIVGGLMLDNKDKFITKSEIIELSNLPSAEVLVGKLLYCLNGPITSFVRTINEPIASLARLLHAKASQTN